LTQVRWDIKPAEPVPTQLTVSSDQYDTTTGCEQNFTLAC